MKKLVTPDEIRLKRVVDRLFALLDVKYPHKFSSAFRSERLLKKAKKDWLKAVAPYDDSAIKYALEEMPKHHKEWPPNSTQFVELCRKYYKITQVLELPKIEKGNSDFSNKCLDKIRNNYL